MKKSIVVLFAVLSLSMFTFCSCRNNGGYEKNNASSDTVKREFSQQDYVGNIVSGGGGYIAENDGVLYFANQDDRNKLYQMDANFENVKKLSDIANDSVSIYIQFYDDKLFYLQTTKTENDEIPWICTLYSYNLSTCRETKVLNENICSYTIHDDCIYYSTLDTKNLYKANIDGSDVQLLKEGDQWLSVSIQYSDGSLYYGWNESLFRSQSDGSDLHAWDIFSNAFLVYDQEIFCVSGGTLLKFNANSNDGVPEVAELGISDVICFTISEDTLYYSTSDEEIYKSDLNGENIEFIADGYAPVVLKDMIFYFNSDDKMVSISK